MTDNSGYPASFYTRYVNKITTALVMLTCLVSAIPFSSAAQPERSALASFRIGSVTDARPGDTIEVPVRLTDVDPGFEMGGFSLFLEYDSTVLQFLSAQPGSVLTTCAWEAFAGRMDLPEDCDGPCRKPAIRLFALADNIVPAGEPLCWADYPGDLANLYFVVRSPMDPCDDTTAIRWVWYDCLDNEVASKNGDSVFYSDDVFEYDGTLVTADQPFPNNTGAREECFVSETVTHVIDYHHGSVAIACSDSVGPPLQLVPDTMYVFEAYGFDTLWGTAYLGNLTEEVLGAIDLGSIQLNGDLAPLGAEFGPGPEGFAGPTVVIAFDIRTFVAGYPKVFGTTTQSFSVDWQDTSGAVLSESGLFVLKGHREGDINADGVTDIADLTALLSYLFSGGAPVPTGSADLDMSGRLNVADVTLLVRLLFE